MAGALPWRIEETCFNAFPSLKQVMHGGWLMRFSEGLSRRANSVNPLGGECGDVGGVGAVVAARVRAGCFTVGAIGSPRVMTRRCSYRRFRVRVG